MEQILKDYIKNNNVELLNYWSGKTISGGCKSGQIRNSYILVKDLTIANNNDNNNINNEYYVSIINENDNKTDLFLFDNIEKFRKIDNINYPIWYKLTNGYVGTNYINNNKHKIFRYFHQHILDYYGEKIEHNKSIDHINRNPLDNRLSNLRIINQSHQNHNQTDRPRGANLDITHTQIKKLLPKNITYVAQKTDTKGLTHGEHFAIEIKYTDTNNIKQRVRRKTTKSQNVSLPHKLIQAIKIKHNIIIGNTDLKVNLDLSTNDKLENYIQDTKYLISNIINEFNLPNSPGILNLDTLEIKTTKKLEKLKCPECNKELTGKSSLTRHIKSKHYK